MFKSGATPSVAGFPFPPMGENGFCVCLNGGKIIFYNGQQLMWEWRIGLKSILHPRYKRFSVAVPVSHRRCRILTFTGMWYGSVPSKKHQKYHSFNLVLFIHFKCLCGNQISSMKIIKTRHYISKNLILLEMSQRALRPKPNEQISVHVNILVQEKNKNNRDTHSWNPSSVIPIRGITAFFPLKWFETVSYSSVITRRILIWLYLEINCFVIWNPPWI